MKRIRKQETLKRKPKKKYVVEVIECSHSDFLFFNGDVKMTSQRACLLICVTEPREISGKC